MNRFIAFALGPALLVVGCATTESNGAIPEPTVGGISEERLPPLPNAPEGYSLVADGEVWTLTNESESPESPTVTFADSDIQLGSGLTMVRTAEVVGVSPVATDPNRVEITFGCLRSPETDYLSSVDYRYDGETLTVNGSLTGGFGGEECGPEGSFGPSIVLPLPEVWNEGSEVRVALIG